MSRSGRAATQAREAARRAKFCQPSTPTPNRLPTLRRAGVFGHAPTGVGLRGVYLLAAL